jgi:hypothetical protein
LVDYANNRANISNGRGDDFISGPDPAAATAM